VPARVLGVGAQARHVAYTGRHAARQGTPARRASLARLPFFFSCFSRNTSEKSEKNAKKFIEKCKTW
jgi:hypothetical protein